ncbi:hypothetical protein HH214_08550 [Mucilaginibacter robiniae]|uniref:DUF3300 domain-containing protein n=1 Tax=Mucilaginibacter robiniae TaxID=2728022 RepID=A0A7L5DXU3_9SPHI|nr:hypothetical protein [Mucilaginibacter robiniae]QJD95920.1 hypothetical protein HH214_08550 [Mucilaginibacter robiniae]
MKKVIIAATIALSSLAFSQAANAQINFSVGINIGNQPDWGPVGYNQANYYYMPDIDTYYDVNTHQFVYFNGGQWINAYDLPSRYSNYDLYNGYKVVINDRTPWTHANVYRSRYASFRGRHDQGLIRDSHDARYRNHWAGNNGRGRGNSFGNGHHGQMGNGYSNGRGFDQNNRGGYNRGNNGQGNGNFDRGQGNNRGNGQNGNWNNGQGGNRGNSQNNGNNQGGNRGNGQGGNGQHGDHGHGDRHP